MNVLDSLHIPQPEFCMVKTVPICFRMVFPELLLMNVILLPNIWNGSCVILMELLKMPDVPSVLVQVVKINLFNFDMVSGLENFHVGFNLMPVWSEFLSASL